MQNAPLGAFCNTFDLHKAIIGLENQFVAFLRVAVLDRFYCTFTIHPCLKYTYLGTILEFSNESHIERFFSQTS